MTESQSSPTSDHQPQVPEAADLQFEGIAPEIAQVNLPEPGPSSAGRVETQEDSEMPRDYDLTKEEFVEIQNRTKAVSLFFCVCQILVFFMLFNLLNRIDSEKSNLDTLKVLEAYMRKEEAEKFADLNGSLQSIQLTWWYARVNLLLYVPQILLNLANWFFVQLKQNQGINYSIRTNQVRFFKQNHYFKTIDKLYAFVILAFQFFGSFVVWNQTATQASRMDSEYEDWWYLAHIMLLIRFSFYISIVAAVIAFVAFELCSYWAYLGEQRRSEAKRAKRLPQVLTFLEEHKRPYSGHPDGAELENCAICLEDFMIEKSETVVLDCHSAKTPRAVKSPSGRRAIAQDAATTEADRPVSPLCFGMRPHLHLKQCAAVQVGVYTNQILPQAAKKFQMSELEHESPSKQSITLAPQTAPTAASEKMPGLEKQQPASERKEERRHIFHFSCLRTWVYSNDVCPLCKRLVVKPES